jgi:secretion/DNA translocation related TadE-like protein
VPEKIAQGSHLGDGERGSVAIASLAGMALVMVLLAGLGDLASFFIARTRAQTAADAAALAAAAELIPGIGTDPISQAREFASANGGRLVGCQCRLGTSEAIVTVAVPVRFTLQRIGSITDVRARAQAEVLERP